MDRLRKRRSPWPRENLRWHSIRWRRSERLRYFGGTSALGRTPLIRSHTKNFRLGSRAVVSMRGEQCHRRRRADLQGRLRKGRSACQSSHSIVSGIGFTGPSRPIGGALLSGIRLPRSDVFTVSWLPSSAELSFGPLPTDLGGLRLEFSTNGAAFSFGDRCARR
jgi:hypothetical protein